MENLLLENSVASIKQTLLSPTDSTDSYYFVITGEKEALEFKIIPEKLVKDAKFKKLYCISKGKVTSVLDNFDLSSKLLLHPSVKVIKKTRELVCKEPVHFKEPAKTKEPVQEKKKKNNLTKESFFSSFKKFGKFTENEGLQSENGGKETVKEKKVEESKDVKEIAKVKEVKVQKDVKQVKKQVKKKVKKEVSEKSMKQEADLMDMFDKEEEMEDEKDEKNEKDGKDEKEEKEEKEGKKVRKKRKVLKTMTFMEGKYMKTRDVEAWESYSEEEDNKMKDGFDEILKKKRKSGQQQYSISSFFTKK